MTWEYEEKAWANGYGSVCGVDEAGRGPVAGPVCAAAVILPAGIVIEGLNDSVALVESVTKDTLAVLPAPDGSFRYKGRYDEPTAAALVRKNGQTAAVLYIEPGNIRIEGRLNAEESSNHDKIEYYPSGTPANDAFGAHMRFVNRALHAYNFEDHDQAYRAALEGLDRGHDSRDRRGLSERQPDPDSRADRKSVV